jgi:hypothetical protein
MTTTTTTTTHTPLMVRSYTPSACGCYGLRDTTKPDGPVEVVYCPTHAHAPAMLAGYREAVDLLMQAAQILARQNQPNYARTFAAEIAKYVNAEARALLRAVEG